MPSPILPLLPILSFPPLFSPFLLGAHDYVYAIGRFPLWLPCTTQNRCTALIDASTMVTKVGLHTLCCVESCRLRADALLLRPNHPP